MTPQLKEKESLIAQIEQKDVLLSYPFENIKSFTNFCINIRISRNSQERFFFDFIFFK